MMYHTVSYGKWGDRMSIKKVAEIAGVSVSTVSRVLSDPDHRCSSEEVRQRILQAARELDYVPNEAARSLKSGKAGAKQVYYIDILLTRVISDENDPFFSEILRLAEIEIRRNSCIVSSIWYRSNFSNEKYCMSEDVEGNAAELYKNREHRSDGLIIIGKCCPRALKALEKYEKNIVSINRNSTNYEVDEVLCDGRKIALTAIEQLVKCGHSKIGYVGDCHNEMRFLGYQEALTKYRLDSDIDYIFDTVPGEEQGYKAMEYFLKQSDPPTGIYCANDILALRKKLCKNNQLQKNDFVVRAADQSLSFLFQYKLNTAVCQALDAKYPDATERSAVKSGYFAAASVQSVQIHYLKLTEHFAPVPKRHCPFFGYLRCCQIQSL